MYPITCIIKASLKSGWVFKIILFNSRNSVQHQHVDSTQPVAELMGKKPTKVQQTMCPARRKFTAEAHTTETNLCSL